VTFVSPLSSIVLARQRRWRGSGSMPPLPPPPAASSSAEPSPRPRRASSNTADPAEAAAAAALASGSPPPPEEWLRTARQGLDEPATWEGLKAILAEWRALEAAGRGADAAAPLGRLGRSRDVTVAYRAHRKRVLEEWESMSDYAAVEILGWAEEVVEEDGVSEGGGGGERKLKKRAGARTSRHASDGPVFTPNDFPYFFEQGVKHELLWSASGPLPDDVVERAVAGRVRELYGGGGEGARSSSSSSSVDGEAVWWVNPIELKSVPAIWHAHVVLRRRKG